MATPLQKVAGYSRLLREAEVDLLRARLDVSCHRHGAAQRLREAERERDSVRRLYDDACLVAFGGPVGRKATTEAALAAPHAFDTLAPDFGVDDERASR